MNNLEFIFIVIEMICIVIEIGLEIFSIIQSKKQEKKMLNKLKELEIENRILEKYLK